MKHFYVAFLVSVLTLHSAFVASINADSAEVKVHVDYVDNDISITPLVVNNSFAASHTTFKIAFNANGGEGKMSAQTFTYGKATKLNENSFKRSGYTFNG